MEIKSIGVIGAGQMGLGIAHVCAASGHDVNIVDIDDAALEKAVGTIDSNLGRLVSRGKISDADKKAALSKISTNTSLDSLSNCDLVIEAATENEEIKKAIYAQVCPILKEDAILSTNTSSLSLRHFLILKSSLSTLRPKTQLASSLSKAQPLRPRSQHTTFYIIAPICSVVA